MNSLSSRRLVKIPTPESLANIALYYLGRYASTETSLRRVLKNRLQRGQAHHPDFANDREWQNQLHSAIEIIIQKHKKSGALNDASFAEMKIRSLRRAGRSQRAIHQKLSQKGVKPEIIQQAFADNEGNVVAEEAELTAALRLARRRRLGPFHVSPAKVDRLHKDIAALARAGFSIDIIRKVLGWVEEVQE